MWEKTHGRSKNTITTSTATRLATAKSRGPAQQIFQVILKIESYVSSKSTEERPQGRSSFCFIGIKMGLICGILLELSCFEIGKWKPIWQSPYWNFIMARNMDFANRVREVFAELLQLRLEQVRFSASCHWLLKAWDSADASE